MPEVMIYYTDLEKYVDSAIEAIKDPKLKENTALFKTEILASLTVTEVDDIYKNTDCKEQLSLWRNKEHLPREKAELLLGPYYIQLEKAFLEEVRKIIVEGTVGLALMAFFPSMFSTEVPSTFSLKKRATELLISVFMSINKLSAFERCLYHHVAEHLTSNARFTIKEFDGWIPQNKDGSCNMCQFNKDCGFYDNSNGRCKCRDQYSAIESLQLLVKKGVVNHVIEETYEFIH